MSLPESDLTNLASTSATEPNVNDVAQALIRRARTDLPYTHASFCRLVAVNPQRPLADLSDVSAEEYRKRAYAHDRSGVPLEPHPYELAGRVYHKMRASSKSQAIIYQGVSGSGKTFTSGLVTAQLLRLSTHSSQNATANQVRALESVLGSFTAAKTSANAGASRISKYLELHFDDAGSLAGAQILTFGLDKSRLNHLSPNERSFNIFYQLLAGASEEERQSYKLSDASSYRLLSSSGCYYLPHEAASDDEIAFAELKFAMTALGFKDKHMEAIFSLLSAILLLGNIEFQNSGNDSHLSSNQGAEVVTTECLEDAAELLGLFPEELAQTLTNQSRWVHGELISSLLDVDEASEQRNSLMRDLYATLLAFITESANHRLAAALEKHEGLTKIVQLDMPGFQTRGSESASRLHELVTNASLDSLHDWMVRQVFDDSAVENAEMLADGVHPGHHLSVDTSAVVELLRGSVVGTTSTDRSPGGIYGVLERSTEAAPIGATEQSKAAALLHNLDGFAPYASFVSSRRPYGDQDGRQAVFGIRHYQSTVHYGVHGMAEANEDLFDSAFVQMLKRSQVPFVARLFAGPAIATESHPLDYDAIVSAQVSVAPLRQPSSLSTAAGESGPIEPFLDTSRPQGVAQQVNASLSCILSAVKQAETSWSVFCMRPNNTGQADSIDEATVSEQVAALHLPQLATRFRATFAQSLTYQDFCDRYDSLLRPAIDAAGATHDTFRQKAQAFAIATSWRESIDFAFGEQKVWLSYDAWRQLEDHLPVHQDPMPQVEHTRDLSPGGPDNAAPARPQYPSESTGYLPPLGGDQSLTMAESEHNLLLHAQRSDVANPFATPGFDSMDHGHRPLDHWDQQSGFFDKAYGEDPIMMSEKASNAPVRAIDAVEEVPITATRRWWVRIVWLFTWWIPSSALSRFGRMKRPDVQMAWREKVTICSLIFLACAVILFYILAFGKLICPDMDKAWDTEELATHAGTDDYYVAVAGKVYDLTKFYGRQHSDIANSQVDSSTMLELAGQDLTPYFPIPLTLGCPGLVTDDTVSLSTNANLTAVVSSALHTSGSQQTEKSSKLADADWYTARFLPTMNQYYKGSLVYTKKTLQNDSDWRSWAIVEDKVYDLTNYVYTQEFSPGNTATAFFDSSISDLFKSQAGQDITTSFQKAIAGLNSSAASAHRQCLDNAFYVGKVDFRETARCQVQNYLLLAFSCLIVATVLAKFVAALQLSTKRNPEQQDKFVICQVPCYTEGEEELRKTIDSLAGQKYDDKRKLLFIICDGMIVGSGNETPTPRIVLDILGVDRRIDPEPLRFKSVAEGSKQLNYGKVYSGLYEFEGHVVPYVVVVKCGRPSERTKPGNRGKRDTQLLLMRYLNRVHHDSPMAPLELEIYHQMKNVIGIDPAFYEFVLMVDADTSVEPDGLNRLVAVAADDSRIIAICGETTLDNEEGSWWTMIQVYEYYISHHLAKAFESLFGSVTCLPGCFSMYRLRSADKGKPLFIANRIIDSYSENVVDTLHKKNLLHLGEDRYLTTLILKNFPTFRTKFTPDAKAHTAAPDQFGVLLSQRRRWINSTIHNLAELVLMPELCGFCLFSMRFVVFVDLLGTIILPATVVYLLYLIISVATGQGQFPLISIILIAAVYGLQAIIFLLQRQWQYIGWLIIYILAYPIYSFFLPLYSFWHMDDFSWGNTRIVVGEKGNKKIIAGTDDEPYDDSMVPLVRFSDYQREVWDRGNRDGPSSRPGSDAGSLYSRPLFSESFASMSPQHTRSGAGPFFPGAASRPDSLYKQPSLAGSQGDSIYGGPGIGGADFYQSTNILEKRSSPVQTRHSSYGWGNGSNNGLSRPASMAFGPASRPPSMSLLNQQSLPQMPMSSNPSMSWWGMPSMYGMPSTPSAYGMPGTPAPPMNMMPSQSGSHSSSAQRSSMMPLGGATNPFAATAAASTADISNEAVLSTNEDTHPSDEALTSAIVTFLGQQSDLYSVTKRQVRGAVEASFVNADLSDKRKLLNRLIDEVLEGKA